MIPEVKDPIPAPEEIFVASDMTGFGSKDQIKPRSVTKEDPWEEINPPTLTSLSEIPVG